MEGDTDNDLGPGKPGRVSNNVRSEKSDANVVNIAPQAGDDPEDFPQSDPDTGSDSEGTSNVVLGRCSRASALELPLVIDSRRYFGLIDSGADCSVIRTDVWDSITSPSKGSRESVDVNVYGADGKPIQVSGTGVINALLGTRNIEINVLIARIKDPLILGLDFLEREKAVFDVGNRTLTFGTEEFFLERRNRQRVCRLALRRAIVLPPLSENLVTLDVIGELRHRPRAMLVVPTGRFSREAKAVMGSTLVSGHGRGVSVLMVNPVREAVVVESSDLVAYGESVEAVWNSPGDPEGSESDSRCPESVRVDSEHPPACLGRTEVDSEPEDQAEMYSGLPEHLRPLLNNLELTAGQRSQVATLIGEMSTCFQGPGEPLGRTAVVSHHVDTGSHEPVKQRTRRIPQKQQEIVASEVQKMLDLGVIEPSDSPWSSPVVLVRKKNGSIRFCVDYRQVNALTKKDSYPLPNIQDTYDGLAGSVFFCSLDLAAGYWQVEVEKADRPKAAFATRDGLFQFKTMPFGLCNAPATFERLMERILQGHLWKRCMVYIDDVIVFGKSFDETRDHLRIVLSLIRDAGLKLKPEKCHLFQKELLYLGFVIDGEGIKPDPKKVSAVRNWPVPCGISDVRSFLGFANYHRRFIKRFGEIAEPLLEITRGRAPLFHWSEAQQKSFDMLRHALATAPVVSHPVSGDENLFVLDTDASAYAIGGELLQRVNGEERVIAYSSRTLSKSQRNYCTTYRELLGVVWMIRHFRQYLWGRRFVVRSDHSSLRWLNSYKDADGMLARWLSHLQQYDFHIEYRPGARHGNADGLSRCHRCGNPECPGAPTYSDAPESFSDGFPDNVGTGFRSGSQCPVQQDAIQPSVVFAESEKVVPDLSIQNVSASERRYLRILSERLDQKTWLTGLAPEDIAAAQKADSSVGVVYGWIESGSKPDSREIARFGEEVKILAARWNQLTLAEGILIRTIPGHGKVSPVKQIVLPNALRDEILHQLHDLRISGHMGKQRTIDRVKERFYWPGLALDVARWCAQCTQCARRKGKPHPRRIQMQTLPTGAPFDRIALDILDTHRPTSKGFRYILVVSDYFTKWTDAYPIRKHTAEVVANLLVTRWFVYHGVPKAIHSDQGKEFESRLFHGIATLLGARKIRTSPYRPQSDGQVERFNRTLLGLLSAFVSERVNDWDVHLPYVLMAYRTSVHASTGCTPQLMVFGREANHPVDLVYPSPDRAEDFSCSPEYVEFLRRAVRTAHEFARTHLHKAVIRQKRGYDAHARDAPKYKPGQLVRWYYPPIKQGNKFGLPWSGPWRVIESVTPVDYKIEKVSSPAVTKVVHFDVLKPFELPDLPETVDTALSNADKTDSDKSDHENGRQGVMDCLSEHLAPWDRINSNPEDIRVSDADESSSGGEAEILADDCINTPPLRRSTRQRRKPARYASRLSSRIW